MMEDSTNEFLEAARTLGGEAAAAKSLASTFREMPAKGGRVSMPLEIRDSLVDWLEKWAGMLDELSIAAELDIEDEAREAAAGSGL